VTTHTTQINVTSLKRTTSSISRFW
jgi:hypothetical protein